MENTTIVSSMNDEDFNNYMAFMIDKAEAKKQDDGFDFFSILENNAGRTSEESARERAEHESFLANCHAERHAERAEKENNKCTKCLGHGRIECYYYVSGGMCFKCGGTGKKR